METNVANGQYVLPWLNEISSNHIHVTIGALIMFIKNNEYK
jgi:hypothetical protein